MRCLKKILKWLVACALYWCAGMFLAVIVRLFPVAMRDCYSVLAAVVAIAGCFHFSAIRENARIRALYVFGHEMTHYLVAKLFLRKTGKICLGADGGSVEVQNSNVWITLSPYFLPFYALVVLLCFAVAQQIWSMTLVPRLIFAGVLGEAYAFHCVMTAFALRQAQPDIREYGGFFSYALIWSANLLFLLCAVLVTTVQWEKAWRYFCQMSNWQWQQILTLVDRIR